MYVICISVPGAASTSLRHGRVKIDTMSICFNNMPFSYSVYLSHARNICVVSHQATLPNKFSCLVRKRISIDLFIFGN